MMGEPTFTLGDGIGVIGAGAMGSGIAQVAALSGHPVVVCDSSDAALDRARASHRTAFDRNIERGRTTRAEADEVLARIRYVPMTDVASLSDCAMVIEAVVERLDVKQSLFRSLEPAVRENCVLATNTSSLSIAAIAGACTNPRRVLGVHFFNPAPVMPLVEIIPAIVTDDAVTRAVRSLVDSWGKTTVVASDTPGFIVNRIARPFYGEAIRLSEEGVASPATIDWAMRDIGGFRMGPFELMDFIGHDVNYAVTSSVFEATYFDPRYRPSVSQRRLVEAGLLGRKSGRGFYDYAEGAAKPDAVQDRALGQNIVDRIVAMLVNEAIDARYMQIATASDIELAMTKGVNYPRGLLSWGDEIGAGTVLERLDALADEYREDRYRASVLLRRVARNGGSLVSGSLPT